MKEKCMPFPYAYSYANKIAETLKMYCTEISIAGSIRRKCPAVHDIDIVCIPLSIQDIKDRCKRNEITIIVNGQQNFRFRLNSGIEIDIYFARPPSHDLFAPIPSNYGSLLICRTGSREFNISLVEYAKTLGLTWNPYKGVFRNGELIASETETAIFKALKLPFIPPENRDASAIRNI